MRHLRSIGYNDSIFSMRLIYKDVRFASDGYLLSATVIRPPGNKICPAVLFIHGGGLSIQDRHTPWLKYLARRGFVTLSFHSRGVDKSEGSFEDATLANRLRDAECALRFLEGIPKADVKNINIVASSMGAHVACRLIEKYPHIHKVLLQSAAAYNINAENKKLNHEFTSVIRKKNSWMGSPAFDALRKFRGKIMMVYGDRDTVIPEGVKKIYSSIVGEKGYVILEGSHRLLSPQNDAEKKIRDELFRLSSFFFG